MFTPEARTKQKAKRAAPAPAAVVEDKTAKEMEKVTDEDILKQLQADLKSQKIKHYSSDQLDQMIEESEYIKQWKAIPKARRERLTRK